MAPPESGEDRGRPAALLQFPWLAHQAAVEAQRLDATLAQCRLDAGVQRHARRFVTAGPEDAAGAGRRREREDGVVRVAAQDVQPPAALGKPGLHGLQGLREAPFRGPADRTPVRGALVMDVDDERRPPVERGDRRLVVEAEVVAEPDDVGGHGACFR